MVANDDGQWQQALRDQLAQRTKDDTQMQARWETYVGQRRFWPTSDEHRKTDKPRAEKKPMAKKAL